MYKSNNNKNFIPDYNRYQELEKKSFKDMTEEEYLFYRNMYYWEEMELERRNERYIESEEE